MRQRRVLVDAERVMLPDDADSVAIRLANLLQGRTDPRAERSLEVGEFGDRDRCAVRASDRHPGGPDRVDAIGIRSLIRGGRRSRRDLIHFRRELRQPVLDLRQAAIETALELAHLIPGREGEEQQHGEAGHRRSEHQFDRQERRACRRRRPVPRALVVTKMSGLRHPALHMIGADGTAI